ncbi:MAG: DotU family type IV/VI secretion system protein [Lentisphaeraceae bacterium]|nr:DotU family type IV/VI secretion system protein [Lentisphaeraceae bacterium]
MNALDACEDFFSYICGIVRTSAIGGKVELYKLKNDILKELDKVETKAFESRLGDQWKGIKLPLIFFVDSLISESNLSCAKEWSDNRLAYTLSPPEYAGDEKFYFNLIEVWDRKQSTDDELMAIYYTCLALGFTGSPPRAKLQDSFFNRSFEGATQTEVAESLMKIIKPRIEHLILEPTVSILPENQLHVNKTDLRTPTSAAVLVIAIVLFALVAVMFLTNNLLFHSYTDELMKSLNSIIEK